MVNKGQTGIEVTYLDTSWLLDTKTRSARFICCERASITYTPARIRTRM